MGNGEADLVMTAKIYRITPEAGAYTVEVENPATTKDEGAGCLDACCAIETLVQAVTIERLPDGGLATGYTSRHVFTKTIPRKPK